MIVYILYVHSEQYHVSLNVFTAAYMANRHKLHFLYILRLSGSRGIFKDFATDRHETSKDHTAGDGESENIRILHFICLRCK